MEKLGIIAALDKELQHLLTNLGSEAEIQQLGCFKMYKYKFLHREIFLLNSGIGQIAAAAATQLLISICKVDAIINMGVAGSLNAAYDIGEVVLVTSVVHTDRDTSPIDPIKRAEYEEFGIHIPTSSMLNERLQKLSPQIHTGIDASSEQFIASEARKGELVREYSADICDMEAAGILITAKRNNIPVAILKAISDKADNSAHLEYASMIQIAVKAYSELMQKLILE